MDGNLSTRRAHWQNAASGLSLVETLVALGILGAVMIPMLFMSSAFFTNQLLKTRNSMEVSHNASQFLSRFMEELQYADRLLPESTSTDLRFTYFDPVNKSEKKVGYRLNTLWGNKLLVRLLHTADGWLEVSPYGSVAASHILLPSPAEFKYCTDTVLPCTLTSPEKAILVRLEGWEFRQANGNQQLSLASVAPLDVYIAANVHATKAFMSEQAKPMYSFPASNLGSNVDMALVSLAPGSLTLTNFYLAPSASDNGILSVILPNNTYGDTAQIATVDGRLIFGNKAGHTSGANLYAWHPDTGLTTILANRTGVAVDSIVAGSDGRVFVGEDNDPPADFYTWHPATGLTTILANEGHPGWAAISNRIVDGRVYFTTWSNGFYTWHPATGLTTIQTGITEPASMAMGTAADGRVYWGGCGWLHCSTQFWTWHPSTGLTTVLPTNRVAPGARSTAVSDNGWAFFGTNEASGTFYGYHPSEVLFTLVIGINQPGYLSAAASADGRVYFGSYASSGRFWTWHKDTGLTTIVSGVPYPGRDSTKVAPDGRVYFGSYSSTGRFWTWHPSTGLTTILASANKPGIGAEDYVDIEPVATGVGVGPDGRVFIGESANSGRFWTWHYSTGLSTIVSNIAVPGKGTTQVDLNGRVYFGTGGEVTSNGRYLTWHPSTGLSTIVGDIAKPGYHYTSSVIPTAVGGIFFNQGVNPSTYYRWVPTPTIALRRLALNGSPTKQDVMIQVIGSPNYVAQAQSGDRDMYLVDGIAKTVDHYVPQSNDAGHIVYVRTSQFNWSAWATTVNGVAVDDTSAKIALLDSGNKQIDVYANRFVNGVPNPGPTSFSVAGQAANPTGLAFSNRTGRYLVVDSTVIGGKINVHLYNEAGAFLQSVPIDVTAANLGYSAIGETNFKILLDERNNVLYLLSPALNRVFAMALPIYI